MPMEVDSKAGDKYNTWKTIDCICKECASMESAQQLIDAISSELPSRPLQSSRARQLLHR